MLWSGSPPAMAAFYNSVGLRVSLDSQYRFRNTAILQAWGD
jgi:hypothetical protein